MSLRVCDLNYLIERDESIDPTVLLMPCAAMIKLRIRNPPRIYCLIVIFIDFP